MSGQPSAGHGRLCSISHIPDKSGCPSMDRGAGAFSSGAPSAVRGTPAVGYFNHCADAGAAITSEIVTMAVTILIFGNSILSLVFGGLSDTRELRLGDAGSPPDMDCR